MIVNRHDKAQNKADPREQKVDGLPTERENNDSETQVTREKGLNRNVMSNQQIKRKMPIRW